MNNLLKNFLLLLIFNFSFSNIFSQPPVIQWQNTIGGNLTDELSSIQQTSDGGYIVGGSSNSNISIDKTENSMVSDYWILKTDSAGNILWQNTIGGSNADELCFVQQTKDGGYILGGNSKSNISGDKTENICLPSGSNYDYWIVKTDSLGNIIWQNTIGGEGDDLLTSMQQTDDGGYILGGYSDSPVSCDKTENTIGISNDIDYWIVATDSLGNVKWENTIGGTQDDKLFSIQQTLDKGFILGGWSVSNISGDKTENSIGGDYWIVKTDSIGNIQWQNTIGGNSTDYLYSVQQTNDNGFILGGVSYSDISGDKTENNFGLGDYWIVKTDSLGNIQWENTIGGDKLDNLSCIKQTSDGGYIVGGRSQSQISFDKTESNVFADDFWIIKTDSTGNLQWQNTIGGNDFDYFVTLQQTSDDGFILGGNSRSSISGDKTEPNYVGNDYWIIKLTDNYNSISGSLFFDGNLNTIKDTGELPIPYKTVTEINTTNFAFSDPNGKYNLAVLDTGNFMVSPITVSYYNALPVTHNVYFPGLQLTDSLNDFAFQPTGIYNDLCVTLTPLGFFRAGRQAYYEVSYTNVGTTTIIPTLIFYPDTNIVFYSSNPVPDSVYSDSVLWSFGPLEPFQTGSILIMVNVNPSLSIGTLIHSSVKIEPIAGDANPGCNADFWEVYTRGSYDPNDILVNEYTLFTTQFPNPPDLEYIIRFQNTGNDTAFLVKILNPIDTSRLQLNTFEYVSSSHPVNMQWNYWERNMQFTFENILLPDSNTTEQGSRGFIRYRIKPKNTLSAGDSIANYAAIYFDFNAPVITNNAVTKILLPTGEFNVGIKDSQLKIFPNPTGGNITVVIHSIVGLVNERNFSVKFFDILGKEVKLHPLFIQDGNFVFDVTHLSTGIYVVEVTSRNQIERGKFVKQ